MARARRASKKVDWKLSESAGIVLAIAAIELLFFVIYAQHMYPGYSLNDNYISDLGVGGTAYIFNTSIVAFGLLVIGVGVLLYLSRRYRWIALGFAILGIGSMGVGLFPETTGLPHVISALVSFGTGGLLELAFYRIYRGYMSVYSLIAGVFALILLVFFGGGLASTLHISIGLGHGGIEELIFYNEILWSLIASVSLVRRCA